jgi:hypothetical protein
MMRRVSGLLLLLLACGGVSPSAECKKYLECTEAVTPGSSTGYMSSYGLTGTCWSTNQGAADACTAACAQATAYLKAGAGASIDQCQ